MYSIVRFIIRIFAKIAFSCNVKFEEKNIPTGKLLLCCNHTSIFDIVMVLAFFPHKLIFVAKDELESSPMAWLYRSLGTIFVDRGNMDVNALKKMLDTLNADRALAIFPEGTRVKEIDPKNMKEGSGFLVQKSKSDILCMRIKGKYRFRSKIDITFKPIIKYSSYENFSRKEQRKTISRDIFNTIYDTEYKIEDFEI